MIVVLDTNVVVRAAFRRNFDPDNLLALAKRGEFETAVSNASLRELTRTFGYQHIQRRLAWSAAEQSTFIAEYAAASAHVEPSVRLDVVSDSSDNRFLEVAVESEATYVVTTDRDLLDLGEYQGIRMITQAQFLTLLAADQP